MIGQIRSRAALAALALVTASTPPLAAAAIPLGQSCQPAVCLARKVNDAETAYVVCKSECISPDLKEAAVCIFGCSVVLAVAEAQAANDCTCQAGTSCAGGVCTCDPCQAGIGLVLDPSTCACNCPAGQVMCSSGVCGNPASCNSCPAGTTACGGSCITCPAGQAPDPQTCACACPGVSCPAGQHQDPTSCACIPDAPCTGCAGTCCNGSCVDTNTDTTNCGSCGAACAGGKTCQNGQCACPSNTPDLCNGLCTNFRYDPGNCGGCSAGPNGSFFVCGGSASSPAGPNCCPNSVGQGTCTDVSVDGLNCGACGNSCSGGKMCQSGVCSCPLGTAECNGQCVNAQIDSSNCGACGVTCGGGMACQAGACSCPPNLPAAPAASATSGCPAGKCLYPIAGMCIDCASCPSGPTNCIQNFTCQQCGGACYPRNDGLQACGAAGPACVNGTFPCALSSGVTACCSCGGL